MVQINFAQKSVTVKIVYYGPGMSGKTTNLEVVHQRAPETSRGDLTSISTDGDRTLFFDFMPLDLGTVAGMKTQFQIYTVPGQVYYNSTRKLVLQGVDGVIFIADSSASMMEENLESMRDLEANLAEYGKDLSSMPMVVQYNKRDMPDALPVEDLERALNTHGRPSFEGIANTGQGVFPTLKALAALVLDSIHEQTGRGAGDAAPTAMPTEAAPPSPMAPAVQSAGTGSYPAPEAVPQAPAAEAPPPSLQMEPAPAVTASAQPMQQAPPPQPEQPMQAAPPAMPAQPIAQAPPAQPAQPVQPVQPIAQAPTPQAPTPQAPTPQAPTTVPMDPAQGQSPEMAGVPGGFPQPGAAPPAPAPAQDLSQTGIQPQMQVPVQPQPVAQPQAEAPAPGLRLAQPVAGAPEAQPVQVAAPAAQAAPAPAPASTVMQVPTGTAAPPPPATSRSLPSSPAPRIKPRQAMATPTQAGERKSAMITAVFVTAALAAGVVIGGLAFGLF